ITGREIDGDRGAAAAGAHSRTRSMSLLLRELAAGGWMSRRIHMTGRAPSVTLLAVEPTRTPAMDPNEPLEDVDLVLRHVSRLFPDRPSRALPPPDVVTATAPWLDTQVPARQRRLDRAIDVSTASGERRVLHNEWQLRMEGDVPFRVYEYHSLLV